MYSVYYLWTLTLVGTIICVYFGWVYNLGFWLLKDNLGAVWLCAQVVRLICVLLLGCHCISGACIMKLCQVYNSLLYRVCIFPNYARAIHLMICVIVLSDILHWGLCNSSLFIYTCMWYYNSITVILVKYNY